MDTLRMVGVALLFLTPLALFALLCRLSDRNG